MNFRTRLGRAAATAMVLALALTACNGNGDDVEPDEPGDEAPDEPDDSEPDDSEPDDGEATSDLSGELFVFAAASLTDAFEEIAELFEQLHPEVTTTFNFASSGDLATQINEGGQADVFASANNTQMDNVEAEGGVENRTELLTNVLELVVEAGNPLDITELEDLERDDIILVIAEEGVPAGDFAREMFEAEDLDIDLSGVSGEQDVRATLSRVELGEADVAVVYRSDVVTAADSVEGVTIPDERNVIAEYPIATLPDAPNPDAAIAWVEFVTGPEAQAVLEDAGFIPLS